jgi:signal transduction histidine kinase
MPDRQPSVRAVPEERLPRARRLEAVARLASWVGHELNNELTVILAASDALLAPPAGVRVDARQEAADVRDAANRAAELIFRLMAFALLEGGPAAGPNEGRPGPPGRV